MSLLSFKKFFPFIDVPVLYRILINLLMKTFVTYSLSFEAYVCHINVVYIHGKAKPGINIFCNLHTSDLGPILPSLIQFFYLVFLNDSFYSFQRLPIVDKFICMYLNLPVIFIQKLALM